MRRRALHLAAFAVAAAFVALVGSASAYLGIVLPILALVLLIGWLFSGAMGRSVLASWGLGTAMTVPAASALIIGGTCVALGGGLR